MLTSETHPTFAVVAHEVPSVAPGRDEVQFMEAFFGVLGEALSNNTHVQIIVSGFNFFDQEFYSEIKDYIGATSATIAGRFGTSFIVVKTESGFNIVIHYVDSTFNHLSW